MATRLNEVVSKDGNWKAWVEKAGFLGNFQYEFVVRNQKHSFLRALAGKEKFQRTRRIDLGASYFDPSSQFQAPEMPIGRDLKFFRINFTPNHAELNYTEILHYAQESEEDDRTKRVPII